MRLRRRRRPSPSVDDVGGHEYWPGIHPPPLLDVAPARPEPWRTGRYADRAFLIPRDSMLLVADPYELRRASCDTERLDHLEVSIKTHGFREPLELVVDQLGKISVGDGYHRLVLARRCGWLDLPVIVRRGDHIRGYGRPARDVLEPILLAARAETSHPNGRYHPDRERKERHG